MTIQSWNHDQLFASKRQDWGTPQALFDALDAEFGFDLDAAASPENAKCERYLSEDALSVDWHALGNRIWLNPPYGREIGKWIEKAYLESVAGACVVCLTFARTDTQWWHRWALRAAEVRLIEGRITFAGASQGAPAPSCVLIFDERRRSPRFVSTVLPRR
jgi:site-specific DNA-methyltransferase (adenine-specific)